MIKIFFDDRIFALCEDETKCFSIVNGISARVMDEYEASKLFNLFEKSPQIPEMRVLCEDKYAVLDSIRSGGCFVRAAGGVVHDKHDRCLLIQRSGYWDLPKGKAEQGESPNETALREVQEECGLTNLTLGSKLLNTYHVYRLDGRLMLKETAWFSMSYHGNELPTPQTDEDIERVEWVAREKLIEYTKMYASIKDLLHTAGLLTS